MDKWHYIRKDEPFDWEDVVWSSMRHNRKIIARGRVIGDQLLLTDRNGNPIQGSNEYTHWIRIGEIPGP